jgi:hypothetical protein
MKKIVLLVLVLVSFAQAEVKDKFKISLGVMKVVNFETEMQAAPKGLPIGIRLNTKDQLHMKNDTSVFRLDGYYRFNETHSIDFAYFSVNSDGVTADAITWEGNDIVSAAIHSYFNMDIYRLNYVYSFYHNDKVELALTAGLHITTLDLGISAYGTVNGQPDSYYDSATKVTVPLPVFGFKGEYAIVRDKFYVKYRADYFFLSIDNYKGALVTTALDFEYRFIEHMGVGLGYNVNNIRLEADGDNARVDVTNVLSGVMLNLFYIY